MIRNNDINLPSHGGRSGAISEGKVILARRSTIVDRVSKWVTRNRKWVVAAVLTWVAVSILGVAAVTLLVRAHSENRAALAQTQKSLEESDAYFLQAREIVDHFGVDLAKRLAAVPGADSVRQDILQDTLRYYRSFMDQAERNPLRQREVALTYTKLGRIAEQLNAFQEAIESYDHAERIWQSLEPDDPSRALNANLLGLLHSRLAHFELANRALDVAVACNQRALAKEPSCPLIRRRYALALTNRSVAKQSSSESSADIEALQLALSIQQSLISESTPADKKLELLVDLSQTYGALASAFRYRDAELAQINSLRCTETFEEVIRFRADSENDHHESAKYELEFAKQQAADDLVLALCNRATILNDAGDTNQAMDCIQRAVDFGSQLCSESPTTVRCLHLASALNMAAQMHVRQGAARKHLESLLRAKQVVCGLVEKHESVAEYRLNYAVVNFNLCQTAENLADRDISRAARTELQTQYEWLNEHSPSQAHQVAELVERLNLSGSKL